MWCIAYYKTQLLIRYKIQAVAFYISLLSQNKKFTYILGLKLFYFL